jgi:hypothetical protein
VTISEWTCYESGTFEGLAGPEGAFVQVDGETRFGRPGIASDGGLEFTVEARCTANAEADGVTVIFGVACHAFNGGYSKRVSSKATSPLLGVAIADAWHALDPNVQRFVDVRSAEIALRTEIASILAEGKERVEVTEGPRVEVLPLGS